MTSKQTRFALIFFLFVLAVIFVSPVQAASSQITQNATLSPTITIRMYDASVASDAAAKTVDYTLPYPGLLPDNPLYWLKTFRDRVVSFFISSPIKKADFDLLQSDKRINAAVYLLATNSKTNQSLAITTISKAENYVEEGIGEIKQAKKQGEIVTNTVNLYKQATLKYVEVLNDLETKATGDFKKQLDANENRIKNLSQQISSLPTK